MWAVSLRFLHGSATSYLGGLECERLQENEMTGTYNVVTLQQDPPELDPFVVPLQPYFLGVGKRDIHELVEAL